jgi:Tfp pilus assembly protein PilE
MTSTFKSRQRGLTLISLLFVGALVAVIGVLTAQVVPSVIEYQTILKAVNKAKEGNTVLEVRNIFDRATSIDSISSITAKDLEVTKEDDKVVVRFAYQREFHLVGPAYLTLKYSGQSN